MWLTQWLNAVWHTFHAQSKGRENQVEQSNAPTMNHEQAAAIVARLKAECGLEDITGERLNDHHL